MSKSKTKTEETKIKIKNNNKATQFNKFECEFFFTTDYKLKKIKINK